MADLEETLLLAGLDSQRTALLSGLLGARGYTILTEEGESAALSDRREAPEAAPDLIISAGPPAVLERLRDRYRDTALPVPVIVFGPLTSTDATLAYLRAGAADIVPEPLADSNLLYRAVETQLEKSRLLRQNQEYRQKLETANRELRRNLEDLQADQRAGRQVQMRMLPENHIVLQDIAFDYCILPSLYLSGDFFEYYALDEHRIGFYFADVSGHGASSAFVTVLLRNLCYRLNRNLRRGSSNEILFPDRFLERVNKELLDTEIGKHLTLFAGVIDTTALQLVYSVGAHYPMPILSQSGRCRYLQGKGPPVGLFPDARYSVYHEKLEPGFSILICSDGILEVMNPGSLADKETALLASIAASGSSINKLEQVYGLHQVRELPDDVAIVSIADRVPQRAR